MKCLCLGDMSKATGALLLGEAVLGLNAVREGLAMQTRDLEKNYEAVGKAALGIVETCMTNQRGWEAALAARDVLAQIMDTEMLGRVVEALAKSMEFGDARDAIERSTMSKQAGVAMGEMFGNEPAEPTEHGRGGAGRGRAGLDKLDRHMVVEHISDDELGR